MYFSRIRLVFAVAHHVPESGSCLWDACMQSRSDVICLGVSIWQCLCRSTSLHLNNELTMMILCRSMNQRFWKPTAKEPSLRRGGNGLPSHKNLAKIGRRWNPPGGQQRHYGNLWNGRNGLVKAVQHTQLKFRRETPGYGWFFNSPEVSSPVGHPKIWTPHCTHVLTRLWQRWLHKCDFLIFLEQRLCKHLKHLEESAPRIVETTHCHCRQDRVGEWKRSLNFDFREGFDIAF